MNAAVRQMANAYEKARACAPQPWMVATLLKGVITHLDEAERSFLKGRHSECINRISKAMAILQGLRDNLRPDVSKSIYEHLNLFYKTNIFRISTLMRSGFNTRDSERIKTDIRKMHDAWASMGTEGTGEA